MNIEQLAYLKCPDKIRAALINSIGKAPPVSVIERRLSAMPKVRLPKVAEPKASDALGYVPPHVARKEQERREAEARKAKLAEFVQELQSKPRQIDVHHYPHSGTAQSEKLAVLTCKMLGLSLVDFYGPTRVRQYAHARAIVARILRERNPTIYSLKRIGGCIGRTDHSTVKNLLDNFDTYCRYPQIWETYQALRAVAL